MRYLKRYRQPERDAGRGYVLIAGLLFLLVVSLLAVAMLRSFGLQEKIAGNTREKQRAFEAAQSALRFGEWWLGQGNGSSGTACSGIVRVTADDLSDMKVCTNALPDPTRLPWTTARADYAPPSMTVAVKGSPGGMTGSDINYAAAPSLHINYLGLSQDGMSMLYAVTGAAYGGSESAAVVVQSTYRVGTGTRDLGKE
jgi:type IV pilus assembly protein PilX